MRLIKTRFEPLDNIIGGFPSGRLSIFAGVAHSGVTDITYNFIEDFLRAKLKVGVFNANLPVDVSRVADPSVYISENLLATPREIYVECKAVAKISGLDVAIIERVDALTKHIDSHSLREVSLEFKILAKELDIPVILTVALPGHEPDIMPQLEDLRIYGRIDLDADIVLLFQRKIRKNETKIIIAYNHITKMTGEVTLV